MTTKQRAYLKSPAMNVDPIFQIGKGGLTTEYLEGVEEALEARELIKINVLKNYYYAIIFKRRKPRT